MTPSLDNPYGASFYRVYASWKKRHPTNLPTRWFPIARYTCGLDGAVTPQIIVTVP
jgi:hypothetical protein